MSSSTATDISSEGEAADGGKNHGGAKLNHMSEEELDYGSLAISPADIYGQMGYGDTAPDESVRRETAVVAENVRRTLRPRFCFVITGGTIDDKAQTLTAGGVSFNVGRIITRQLLRSELYAFFVATGGAEFERFRQWTTAGGDMLRAFITDALGSVIAEKTADRMEEALQRLIAPHGMRHTNRFSPGYCGWHVAEQPSLFSMFPVAEPCGVILTPSCLMTPIKSVSGVIGIGKEVERLDYTCGLCYYKDCYKRRRKKGK